MKDINKDDVVLDFQGGYYTQVEIAEIHGCSKQYIRKILDEKILSRRNKLEKKKFEQRLIIMLTKPKWTGIR